MIGNRTILAVIPARAGSKGIVDKNLRHLCGHPLIAYTIEAAKTAGCFDRIIVSTDSQEIAETARAYGAEVPFLRPSHLATDTAGTVDVVLHVHSWLEAHEAQTYESLCLLQPTSPLRTGTQVQDALVRFVSAHGADFLVSVCRVNESPYLMKLLTEDGYLRDVVPSPYRSSRRQDLPTVFRLNGAIYVARTKALKAERSFDTPRTIGYEMDAATSVDIDEEADLKTAASILESLNVSALRAQQK